jgi:hypothetical protein
MHSPSHPHSRSSSLPPSPSGLSSPHHRRYLQPHRGCPAHPPSQSHYRPPHVLTNALDNTGEASTCLSVRQYTRLSVPSYSVCSFLFYLSRPYSNVPFSQVLHPSRACRNSRNVAAPTLAPGTGASRLCVLSRRRQRLSQARLASDLGCGPLSPHCTPHALKFLRRFLVGVFHWLVSSLAVLAMLPCAYRPGSRPHQNRLHPHPRVAVPAALDCKASHPARRMVVHGQVAQRSTGRRYAIIVFRTPSTNTPVASKREHTCLAPGDMVSYDTLLHVPPMWHAYLLTSKFARPLSPSAPSHLPP